LTYSLTQNPSGMTINSSTGAISWTPTQSHVGSQSVTVSVTDGNGGSDAQSFSITVSGSNDAPQITSTPVLTATEDQSYSYDVNAIDEEGDTLTYSLTQNPSGMTINSSSGLISWIPIQSHVGSQSVTVSVTDGNGGSDAQSFSITVANVNDAPQITSTPVLSATENQLYSYDVNATDAEGDPLTYSLTTSPSGITINAGTGLITWTPTGSQIGTHAVTVSVSDGNGGTDNQSFSINVSAGALGDYHVYSDAGFPESTTVYLWERLKRYNRRCFGFYST